MPATRSEWVKKDRTSTSLRGVGPDRLGGGCDDHDVDSQHAQGRRQQKRRLPETNRAAQPAGDGRASQYQRRYQRNAPPYEEHELHRVAHGQRARRWGDESENPAHDRKHAQSAKRTLNGLCLNDVCGDVHAGHRAQQRRKKDEQCNGADPTKVHALIVGLNTPARLTRNLRFDCVPLREKMIRCANFFRPCGI